MLRRLIAALAAAALAAASAPVLSAAAAAPVGPAPTVATFPADGSTTAHPGTTIAVRGANAAGTSMTVEGSISGRHLGSIRDHRSGVGFTFDPRTDFVPGETVTVSIARGQLDPQPTSTFTIASPAPHPGAMVDADATPTSTATAAATSSGPPYTTRPDLRHPTVEVTVPPSSPSGELLFATPRATSATDQGVMIFDEAGELVWFRPTSEPGVVVGDLKVEEHLGHPVLTWFEGVPPFGAGHYRGSWVVLDDRYREIARVRAGNGMEADLHDIELTDRGTALVVIYNPVYRDLSGSGGSEEALVLEAVVQEIDLVTEDVLFEWHSLDDIPVQDSFTSITGPTVDYTHINSVDEMSSGDLLVSLRNTSEIVRIDKATATVEWRLGGKQSDFAFDDEGISFPHHARELPDGTISIFDNGNQKSPPRSRGVIYDLDEGSGTASRVKEYRDTPTDTFAGTQGSAQVLDSGNALVAWGGTGRVSELDGLGAKLFEARLTAGGSYRIVRDPWHAQPLAPPAIATSTGGGDTTITASWNGATEVATWQALAGDSPESLAVVATASRDTFETSIELDGAPTFVAVAALDDEGVRLGRSPVLRNGAWYDERAARQVSGVYTPVVGDFVAGPEDDILWYAPGTGKESIWPSGPEGFGATLPSPAVNGTYQPIVGDLVGDERDEVLWWQPGRTAAHLWRFQGGTPTTRPVQLPAAAQARLLDHGLAKDEVLLYNPGAGADRVVGLRWTATAVALRSRAIAVSGTYQPLVGDFDGNQWADVLWYQAGAGPDFAWYHGGDPGVGSTGHQQVAITVSGTYTPVVGRLDPSSDSSDDVLWVSASASSYLWTARGRSFGSSPAGVTTGGTSLLVAGARDHVFQWIPSGSSRVVRFVDPGADVLPAGNSAMPATARPIVGRFTDPDVASIFWYRPGSATEVMFVSPGA